MASQWDMSEFKIAELAFELYDDLPVCCFDFKTHLQPTKALDKHITRDSAFRPEFAYYSYLGTNYARRRFEFIFANNGLIFERKEWLAYYKTNGDLGPEFLIKDRTFNHGNPEDFQQALSEQIGLRKDIVSHIKTVIAQVVSIANPMFSLPDIIMVTDPFFQELTNERIAFVEIGSHDYRDRVLSIDLDTTPHTYLDGLVAPGVTLKDYIASLT